MFTFRDNMKQEWRDSSTRRNIGRFTPSFYWPGDDIVNRLPCSSRVPKFHLVRSGSFLRNYIVFQCAWTAVDERDVMSKMRTVSRDLYIEYSRTGARIDQPLTPFWLRTSAQDPVE